MCMHGSYTATSIWYKSMARNLLLSLSIVMHVMYSVIWCDSTIIFTYFSNPHINFRNLIDFQKIMNYKLNKKATIFISNFMSIGCMEIFAWMHCKSCIRWWFLINENWSHSMNQMLKIKAHFNNIFIYIS